MAARRNSSNAQGSSFFPGASNISITSATMVGTQNYNTTVVNPASGPLSLLYNEVAHNAILNAGGRADEVRCHPGTREDVLSKIKRWRDAGSDPLFWLSGPAGAGKTAIVQTFAENYITSALIMINFFFFRSDPTRNHLAQIVATLIFQLLKFYPTAKEYITAVLSDMPYIFDQSIHDQFTHLITNPINCLRNTHNDTRPIVLLIDGLDECGTDPKEAQRAQTTLVRIMEDLVSIPHSPFIVLVSSRPEAHLIRAFNDIEKQYSTIFLDDQYHPSDDIRRYLVAKFATMKKTHNLRHTLDAQWPPSNDIETIVNKSSGQFIYAATIVRFLSSSAASPIHNLEKIKGIRPVKRNSPFAALDAVYTHILTQEDDWDAVKDIVSAQIVADRIMIPLIAVIIPLGYTIGDIATHTANLGALMKLDSDTLIFYHASLVDFLTDPTRSRNIFLDIPIFISDLTAAHFSNKVHNEWNGLVNTLVIAATVTISSAALEDALAAYSPHDIVTRPSNVDFVYSDFFEMLNRVYSESNKHFYKAILRKWLSYLHNNNCTPERLKLAKIKLGLDIWVEVTNEHKKSYKASRFIKGFLKKS